MTKNVKLTQNYIDLLPEIGKKGLIFYNNTHFNHVVPDGIVEGEFYKKTEALDDLDNVPIYDSKECTNVIRTQSMKVYSCHCGDNMEMATDIADSLSLGGIIEEI